MKQAQEQLMTTQVLVPVNTSNTINNHIHVSVRLKPLTEQEQNSPLSKRG